MKAVILSIAFAGLYQLGLAQQEHLPLRVEKSQLSRVEQVIGLDTVRLEFSRPNIKGRQLFGEMIPWGSVWRTGANASTKLELSEQMYINKQLVPKGKYSLLSIPGKEEWTIILNKNLELWGHYGYKEVEDFLRFKVKPTTSSEHIETFNISFTEMQKHRSTIEISWGILRVSFPIEADQQLLDNRLLASISDKLNDPDAHQDSIISAHIYFFAAEYYHQTQRDLEQALSWMNKAISISNVNYFHLFKSDILGSMKRYKEAIAASEEGLARFEKGKNEEWKWRYRQQIEKWKAKME